MRNRVADLNNVAESETTPRPRGRGIMGFYLGGTIGFLLGAGIAILAMHSEVQDERRALANLFEVQANNLDNITKGEQAAADRLRRMANELEFMAQQTEVRTSGVRNIAKRDHEQAEALRRHTQ